MVYKLCIFERNSNRKTQAQGPRGVICSRTTNWNLGHVRRVTVLGWSERGSQGKRSLVELTLLFSPLETIPTYVVFTLRGANGGPYR